MSRVPFESVHGYKIIEATTFDNDRGFALAHNPNAVQPWVTWQFTNDNGRKEMFWGHYHAKEQSAAQDYIQRVGEYKRDYPTLTEKYNYLAAAEMSEEGNYNQIDGVINNEKPSILDHLRQHQTKPPEQTDKPDRPPEIER